VTLGFGGEKKSTPNNGELKWLDFDSAKPLAEKNKKPILVDVYTTWCGWCKRMDKDTYSDKKIAKYLGEKYVLARLNAESTDSVSYHGMKVSNPEFAAGFKVTGYPTILFFEPNGDFITVVPGYLPPDKFIYVAKYIGDGAYKKMSWEEYRKGQGI